MMARRGAAKMLATVCCALVLLIGVSQADVVEHTFDVGNLTLSRLCNERTVVAVNGQLPGPTIEAREGDTVVVHVLNNSPYNLTIHWHGIFQLLSAWADGPTYVTQCPILPGNNYTYRFNITGQEGTLWWHAHYSYLRATVYGALIIRPKKIATASVAQTYPFGVRPYTEVPILLGEWWDADAVQVEEEALRAGRAPNVSDAYTINGLPGRLYACGNDRNTYTLNLKRGETYLLRIINAAVNSELFFKIAGHRFTVVAVDAGYTESYTTNVLVLSPGHTVDALLVADANPRRRYYMAARPYFGPASAGVPFDNTTTVGIVRYINNKPTSTPVMPRLPPFNDTPTAHRFYTALVSSAAAAATFKVPLKLDHKMFITFGLAFVPCDHESGPDCNPPFGRKLAATMNNVSFAFPNQISMLEASYRDQIDGVYTRDFPDQPPLTFNYTDPSIAFDFDLASTVKATKVKRLKYNDTVEVVLQNVAILGTENHPIHLHGFNFFVLAQGFGNYPGSVAEKQFNLVNPLIRNTVAVPDGGWAVIRFIADNPGVWMMHCHLDVHLPIGLGMVFEVDNGPTPSSTLPPPPQDLPRCSEIKFANKIKSNNKDSS